MSVGSDRRLEVGCDDLAEEERLVRRVRKDVGEVNAGSERIVEVEGCTSDSGSPNVERERQSCEQGSQSQYWRRLKGEGRTCFGDERLLEGRNRRLYHDRSERLLEGAVRRSVGRPDDRYVRDDPLDVVLQQVLASGR